MSEPINIPSQTSPTCAACHQALGEQHYRFGQRQVCLNCAGQLHSMQDRNRFAAGPWVLGAIVGIVVAILCGIAWAAIVKATGYVIGFAAIGIGIAVSTGVVKAMSNRRGPSVQLIAIVCSVLGILIGKGLLVVWELTETPGFEQLSQADKWSNIIHYFLCAPVITFRPFDIVWYLLAIRAAWQLTKAPPMQLHGPYPTNVPPPPAGLQFETVEPIQPSSQPSSQVGQ